MTAQGEDILAYLESAITAREEAAYAAPRSPWTVRVDDDEIAAPDDITVAEAFALSGKQTRAILELIALHQPASVLRRCAVDRKVIERHAPHHSGSIACSVHCEQTHPGVLVCNHDGRRWPCPDVADLAEGYGWTEGER